jgi:hypothetical protein
MTISRAALAWPAALTTLAQELTGRGSAVPGAETRRLRP